MKALTRLYFTLVNRFKITPDPKGIDTSGIVLSDHPKENNGWNKGWVVNVPSKDIVIICAHANPCIVPPTNEIFVKDSRGKKIYRSIVKIDSRPFDLNGSGSFGEDGDIAICKLNKPFPSQIKAYNFSTDPNIVSSPVVNFKQGYSISKADLLPYKSAAWIRGKKREELLEYGDSGLPWFVWEDNEWKVVSHTTRGGWGEGPWYSHPYIYKELQARIAAL